MCRASRWSPSAALALLLLGAGCHPSHTLQIGGAARTYAVHLPPSGAKSALVIVLHGLGGSGGAIERRTGFDDIADRAGMVVAYPDAVGRRWNDGWVSSETTDDVGFLTALSDLLTAEHGIAKDRVYVIGFSNGASMAHRFACESDRPAAISTVSGTMSAPVRAHCNVGRPVRVLMMHGDADPIVPLDDQVKQTVATWATRDGCAVGAKPDPYASCRESSEVIFTTVRGGAHEWPPFASSAIGDFFSK